MMRIGGRLHFGDTVIPPSPRKPRSLRLRGHLTNAATLAITPARIPPNRPLVQKVAPAPLDAQQRIGVRHHFEDFHYVTVLEWCLTPILLTPILFEMVTDPNAYLR